MRLNVEFEKDTYEQAKRFAIGKLKELGTESGDARVFTNDTTFVFVNQSGAVELESTIDETGNITWLHEQV